MKVLLVYPYCQEERVHAEDVGIVPIGVYYVGALLKEDGYAVEICNWQSLRRQPDRIAAILRRKKPDVIGFSVLHANRRGAIAIARLAKQIDPAVTIVFGGVGATFLWAHLLNHFPEIDYIVLGEGEYPFVRLVRSLAAGDPAAIVDLAGIARRSGGRAASNPRPAPVPDLDALPNPARYFDYQHLALSRGCPGRCTFCGSPQFWGRRVRFHSAEYFVEQLERLRRRGIRFFYFSDDTFTISKPRVLAVCRLIVERRLRISWAAISRVGTVDAQVLRWMRKAGCIQISYGVESGSEAIRGRLCKDISTEAIHRAFALTQQHGILARAYFIYGCPGESDRTIAQTLQLIEKIKPLSTIFYVLTIFPGTGLYDDFKKQQHVGDDIWLQPIEDIPYFETDPRLSREQVLAFGRHLRAQYRARLPRYAAAVELVDRKSFYPLHADFLSRLAMTFHQGDYAHLEEIPDNQALAGELYRRALAYHPDARAYLGLGMIAQRQGALHDSVRLLREGLEAFPDDSQMHLCLAVSHMNLGDWTSALDHLQRAPPSEQALRMAAECHQVLGNAEEAAALRRRLSPED